MASYIRLSCFSDHTRLERAATFRPSHLPTDPNENILLGGASRALERSLLSFSRITQINPLRWAILVLSPSGTRSRRPIGVGCSDEPRVYQLTTKGGQLLLRSHILLLDSCKIRIPSENNCRHEGAHMWRKSRHRHRGSHAIHRYYTARTVKYPSSPG